MWSIQAVSFRALQRRNVARVAGFYIVASQKRGRIQLWIVKHHRPNTGQQQRNGHLGNRGSVQGWNITENWSELPPLAAMLFIEP